MDTALEATGVTTRVTPFYTLRTFVDAEYSAILGYGLFQLSSQLANFRGIFKKYLSTDEDFWKVGDLVDFIFTEAKFHDDVASVLILLCVFVILVDEFARRRIIGYLSPCRSIGRFALNVGIGFWFVIGFMFIPEKSTVLWGAIGMSYIFSALWALIARRETLVWRKSPQPPDDSIKPKIKNWDFFLARLSFYIGYRALLGTLFLTVMFGMALLGQGVPKDYSLLAAIAFIGFILVSEAVSCFAENRLIYKYPSPDHVEESGLLISILPMPSYLEKAIRWVARPDTRS